MKPRVRDSQRSKLYAAERQVPGFQTEDRLEEVPDLQAFVKTICDSVWFRREWPFLRLPIQVHDGRRHRRALAYRESAPKTRPWSAAAPS